MTVTLHLGDCLEVMKELDANSFDSIVTDPPYGLSFMGKDWDHGVPGEHFWIEALRVAKPGAHLLAFGGDRTHHRLMCAIEDAGWEIRTCIAWTFGSGFPKSRNIGKAMRAEFPSDALCSCAHRSIETTQDSQSDCPECSRSGDEQPLEFQDTFQDVPPLQGDALGRNHADLHVGDLDAKQANTFLDEASARQTNADYFYQLEPREEGYQASDNKPSDNQGNRLPALLLENHKTDVHISNKSDLVFDSAFSLDAPSVRNSNIPHCPKCGKIQSEYYDGFGTALKPSWEIIVMARKPLAESTVAQNVLAWGTGGINVDGCRVGTPFEGTRPKYRMTSKGAKGGAWANQDAPKFERLEGETEGNPLGRWPANFIHDGSDEVMALMPETKSGGHKPCPNKLNPERIEFNVSKFCTFTNEASSGSAARFFYCAKASKRDRDEGLPEGEHSNHPTVKPTALMRYLCKLVTPPGGIILDPFMGSGSTGKAAVIEGFNFIGIDLNPEYVEISRLRIAHAERQQMRLPMEVE